MCERTEQVGALFVCSVSFELLPGALKFLSFEYKIYSTQITPSLILC